MVFRGQLVTRSQSHPLDAYERQKWLGKGASGSVFQAVHRETGALRAVKVVEGQQLKVNREIQIMKALDHPNIVKLFDTHEDSAGNTYLFLELCQGGTLADTILQEVTFSENQVATIMRSVLRVIRCLERNKILHGDISPVNVAFLDRYPLNRSTMKLIDFGCAVRVNSQGNTKNSEPTTGISDMMHAAYIIKKLLSRGKALKKSGANPKYAADLGIDEMVSKQGREIHDLLQNRMVTAKEALKHRWFKRRAPEDMFGRPPPEDFVARLRRFASLTHTAKAALVVCADNLPNDELEPLRDMFQRFDANGDGFVTPDEIKKGLAQAKLESPSDLVELMKAIDYDGHGALTYSAFLAVLLTGSRRQILEDPSLKAFAYFDGDQTEQDYKANAWSLSASITLIKDLQAEQDGQVSFAELLKAMRAKASSSQSQRPVLARASSRTLESRHARSSQEGETQVRRDIKAAKNAAVTTRKEREERRKERRKNDWRYELTGRNNRANSRTRKKERGASCKPKKAKDKSKTQDKATAASPAAKEAAAAETHTRQPAEAEKPSREVENCALDEEEPPEEDSGSESAEEDNPDDESVSSWSETEDEERQQQRRRSRDDAMMRPAAGRSQARLAKSRSRGNLGEDLRGPPSPSALPGPCRQEAAESPVAMTGARLPARLSYVVQSL
eukprot:TRINITY_DN34761_c0_g1_i1.p1 TRINITY_DN34761_c0_g1~~TRINITY_DN34761_c0_g1_i1.p1  ORF type:complete len:674 (+),score=158.43 TRINITY_DN34761_c0_g1_i1:148-2169(+)